MSPRIGVSEASTLGRSRGQLLGYRARLTKWPNMPETILVSALKILHPVKSISPGQTGWLVS